MEDLLHLAKVDNGLRDEEPLLVEDIPSSQADVLAKMPFWVQLQTTDNRTDVDYFASLKRPGMWKVDYLSWPSGEMSTTDH